MLVNKWMRKPVITINADDSIEAAMKLFKKHNIYIIPVMEKKELVGIIAEKDLWQVIDLFVSKPGSPYFVDAISNKEVREIMTKPPRTVPIDYTLEETAAFLIKNRISGVPVINRAGEVEGIITRNDVLKSFLSLTGAERRGIQYAFEVEDRSGSIMELTDIIREYGGRIFSILTSYEGVSDGYRKAYIRMYGIDRFKLHRLNEALKEKATLIYMIDRLEIRGEID